MEKDIEIRYVWLCFLAIADFEGFVDMPIPVLARRFNIPESILSKAIKCFTEPDPMSRTPDSDGRRIEPIRKTFGWRILNYVKYRNIRDAEERKEYMRNYMKDYMRKYRQNKSQGNVKHLLNSVKQVKPKQKQKQKQNNNSPKYKITSDEYKISLLLMNLIKNRNPKFKEPNLQEWAKHIDRMVRLDKRTIKEVEAVLRWCQEDEFWQNNILSTEKLRKQFDQLSLKMDSYLKKQSAKDTGLCEKCGSEEKYIGNLCADCYYGKSKHDQPF